MTITYCEKVKEMVRWLFDPLILRCYGWKYISSSSLYNTYWEDPETQYWWSRYEAIRICEKRI